MNRNVFRGESNARSFMMQLNLVSNIEFWGAGFGAVLAINLDY